MSVRTATELELPFPENIEGFDPRSAKRLLEQVEHGRPIHHGPFIAESDVVVAGNLAQTTIVVHDRALFAVIRCLPVCSAARPCSTATCRGPIRSGVSSRTMSARAWRIYSGAGRAIPRPHDSRETPASARRSAFRKSIPRRFSTDP